MRPENNKISTLIESIPYIQKFHGKTFVINMVEMRCQINQSQ